MKVKGEAQFARRARSDKALRVIDAYVCRDGTDEADQLLVGGNSHSAVPLWQPARWTQSPARRSDSLRCEVASWLLLNKTAAS